MLRGINGQIIFEDREDFIKLLETIKGYREESGYHIYGYCLMNNHIHLLIKEGKEDLEKSTRGSTREPSPCAERTVPVCWASRGKTMKL